MPSNMIQDNVEEINEKLNRFWTLRGVLDGAIRCY